jgi:endoglucanase
MCPLETGLGSTFNETYFSEFQSAITYITSKGGYVILDAHNYMRESFHAPLLYNHF